MSRTTSLHALRNSARLMGLRAHIIGTGGNVVALSVVIDGDSFLVSLDDGTMRGQTWTVSTDGDTRETRGETESEAYPVNSDADQIMRDVIGWTRGEPWAHITTYLGLDGRYYTTPGGTL